MESHNNSLEAIMFQRFPTTPTPCLTDVELKLPLCQPVGVDVTKRLLLDPWYGEIVRAFALEAKGNAC